jgi:hypothetical protein
MKMMKGLSCELIKSIGIENKLKKEWNWWNGWVMSGLFKSVGVGI